MFERRKISTGWFQATWNGEPTGFQILNGSLGTTGRNSPNMYGFSTPAGKIVWVGSLASATASVKRIVERRAAAGERTPAGC